MTPPRDCNEHHIVWVHREPCGRNPERYVLTGVPHFYGAVFLYRDGWSACRGGDPAVPQFGPYSTAEEAREVVELWAAEHLRHVVSRYSAIAADAARASLELDEIEVET